MVDVESHSTSPQSKQPAFGLAIAATFTAEPLKATLDFWLEELGFRGSIDFAPYNQVFQELLDPTSLLASNRQGINIILIRLEDWTGGSGQDANEKTLRERLTRNADELINAVQTAISRTKASFVVALCPDSPHTLADNTTRSLFQQISARIIVSLEGVTGLYLVRPDDFKCYPVENYYDPQRDHLGHIPYTSLFFAALGTVLVRKVHAIISAGHKVIVLDCDNTLWSGVVGEDGYAGITIPEAFQRLQRVMVEQSRKGILLCLCSKNDEASVLEVFEHRPDMIMKRDHIVSSRINWLPKSVNIHSLAQELNLGLDSFIFLDDNPVECAEVRAGCPDVLVFRLPIESDIARFVENIWPFDRLRTTSEDQHRTAMYKQELERTRFQKQAMSIGEFLAGLELRISVSEPSSAQLSRVAQLTQRTNQFNFTTRRRSDAEIVNLSDSGLECRVVEVADRFGEYGLVGVMIFGSQDDYLELDTFLLSCRVLGRGV